MHMVYNRDLSQRLFFAAVAIFSFTGNLFFIVLIVRNRKLMKNAYHVILLSLAITDMMTGRVIALLYSVLNVKILLTSYKSTVKKTLYDDHLLPTVRIVYF